MIIGGVVPVVNLKGIQGGQMVLDGAAVAQIYLGEITKWNDAHIKKLNPALTLPATAIAPIYRSDGSGTNFLFSTYLSNSYPKFKETIGANTSVQWPAGIGAKGNEGVANMTTQTDGAIGYVEYAYAKQNKMAYADLINSAGKKVVPDAQSFQAAAANADWANAPGYHLILTNQPGEKSWPITGASFILLHAKQEKPEAGREVLKFFHWAYRNGQRMAEDLGYVEYAYARQNKLAHGQMQNRAGKFVEPDDGTFKAAAANADWKSVAGMGVVLTDQQGDKAWPITGASFILLHAKQEKPEAGREVLKFFNWAYKNGSKMAQELDYVPMPDPVVKQIESSWKMVTDGSGKALY